MANPGRPAGGGRDKWGEVVRGQDTAWGMKGYCTMPYAYLTSAQLAQDFWAIYAVEKNGQGARRPAKKAAARRALTSPSGP